MTAITNADLTTKTVGGNGVFDVLMSAAAAHLEAEFAKNRIKGAEYSEVYLGAMTQVLQTATQFLLSKQKVDLEAQLIQKQIDLTQAQIDKAASEKTQVEAQTALINQQKTNLIAEALNIPKQGALIDAQKDTQVSQQNQIAAQTLLVNQQKANAVAEYTVLTAQECKLRAEYDLTVANVSRTNQEITLLTQKTATEKAQVLATGVDPDSIVGRQKGLYLAQANGFARDAEQKAAKVLIDSWNVRRTTDSDATPADGTNKLNDTNIGKAVQKLLDGISA